MSTHYIAFLDHDLGGHFMLFEGIHALPGTLYILGSYGECCVVMERLWEQLGVENYYSNYSAEELHLLAIPIIVRMRVK